MKRGDYVWIERGDQRVKAMVVLASNNGRSLMLMFDAFFRTGSGGGFAGMMPVLQEEDGLYYDIVEHEPVTVSQVNLSFTCPKCGLTSHHPEDVRHGYCGNCHEFTGREA